MAEIGRVRKEGTYLIHKGTSLKGQTLKALIKGNDLKVVKFHIAGTNANNSHWEVVVVGSCPTFTERSIPESK
jgi:hypothetical protein